MNNRAFTLVEMMVSLAIFSMVAVVALGAVVKIIAANQKAQSLQSAVTNLDFALESISRELRVGTTYECVKSIPNDGFDGTDGSMTSQGCDLDTTNAKNNDTGAQYIAFNSSRTCYAGGNPKSLATVYRFIYQNQNLYLQKAEQAGLNSIHPPSPRCGPAVLDANFTDILSLDNITLSDYRLGVDTSGPYPLVFIRLLGYAGTSDKDHTDFDIQTTISQRISN